PMCSPPFADALKHQCWHIVFSRAKSRNRVDFPANGASTPSNKERYAASDLALSIFQPTSPRRRATQAEHVAALRAMQSLARKFPDRFVLKADVPNPKQR